MLSLKCPRGEVIHSAPLQASYNHIKQLYSLAKSNQVQDKNSGETNIHEEAKKYATILN